MAMAAKMARVMLLLVLLLTQIFGVLAGAARPLKLEGNGWMEGGIGMVAQMLGGAKQSGSNPPGHCC
ncbi:hypothetical protein BRADI_5g06580v3 [Brachypodium distachyon]|uniref:Uncharacterized protein n=1 Tax=Brachypodium distachyon TaxID=15368 RepID=A0A0Q3I7S7_BRADI|nr:hypothetical protein BRADI_5g06580v3 [Brachypodium distachyon]